MGIAWADFAWPAVAPRIPEVPPAPAGRTKGPSGRRFRDRQVVLPQSCAWNPLRSPRADQPPGAVEIPPAGPGGSNQPYTSAIRAAYPSSSPGRGAACSVRQPFPPRLRCVLSGVLHGRNGFRAGLRRRVRQCHPPTVFAVRRTAIAVIGWEIFRGSLLAIGLWSPSFGQSCERRPVWRAADAAPAVRLTETAAPVAPQFQPRCCHPMPPGFAGIIPCPPTSSGWMRGAADRGPLRACSVRPAVSPPAFGPVGCVRLSQISRPGEDAARTGRSRPGQGMAARSRSGKSARFRARSLTG